MTICARARCVSRGPSLRLSTRITRWCVAVGTGFVVLLTGISLVVLYLDEQEELDAIAKEEMVEMAFAFGASDGTSADFATCAAWLQASHPENGMAWRVWNREDGSLWGSFGADPLLARVPMTRTGAPSRGAFVRWSRAPLTAELEVGFLIEGGRELAHLRTFLLVALATIALAAGISFLAGSFLGRRVGGALCEIARDTRASTQGDRLSPRPRLPEEMEEVVDALREALARIRSESERARLLASGLAHELRSPLQNLLLQAEVTLLRERTDVEYRAALSRQILDLEELSRAVDNLVTLCAPPEARKALFGEVFDLAAEARLRSSREEARLAQAGIRLRTLAPVSLPFRGDREGILLALRNLVANAIDWSPPAGLVEVRIESAAGTARIQVDDQGPGVPESERERIFLPFERGRSQPNGRAGYGLGLALVRTVADLHQGTVRVSTSVMGGASFRIELPYSTTARQA